MNATRRGTRTAVVDHHRRAGAQSGQGVVAALGAAEHDEGLGQVQYVLGPIDGLDGQAVDSRVLLFHGSLQGEI